MATPLCQERTSIINREVGVLYTSLIVNKAEELDIFNIFAIDNLNIAVPGKPASKSSIVSCSVLLIISKLPQGSWTLAEIALGGNDLLGFLLFPRFLPPNVTAPCFDINTVSGGLYGNHYSFKGGAACEVINQILTQAEANLDKFAKDLIKVANNKTMIIIRNFDNPILSTPAEFGGASCEQVVASGDVYGVSLGAAQAQKYLNGTKAKDGFEGLNTRIARVARKNGLKVANIRGTLKTRIPGMTVCIRTKKVTMLLLVVS